MGEDTTPKRGENEAPLDANGKEMIPDGNGGWKSQGEAEAPAPEAPKEEAAKEEGATGAGAAA